MVVAERVTTSFGRLLIEPAAREYAASRLNPHHCGNSPRILDRRFTLKACLSPMIDVALASDVVMSNAVMRQPDDRFLPSPDASIVTRPRSWIA